MNNDTHLTPYEVSVIETYLHIRKASYETEAGDTPVWNALVGSLNLVQSEFHRLNITHDDIESIRKQLTK